MFLDWLRFTCFSRSTLAIKRSNSIMASGPIETCSDSAVIDVLGTIVASPAIDTNTVEASYGVCACRTVFTDTWSHGAFVYILTAVSSWRKIKHGILIFRFKKIPNRSTKCKKYYLKNSLPVYDGGQWQVYVFTPSMQVAPFWHRCPGQSLILVSQSFPV